MNYLKRISEMHARGELDTAPGKSLDVTVSHDDWCMVFSGGACNCEPDIKHGTPQQQPNRAARRAAQKRGRLN